MTKVELLQLLGWCSFVYIAILLLWLLILKCCRAWVYRVHNKWFSISEEKFDQIHYLLVGFFKLIVVLFFLVPYLVLRAI